LIITNEERQKLSLKNQTLKKQFRFRSIILKNIYISDKYTLLNPIFGIKMLKKNQILFCG